MVGLYSPLSWWFPLKCHPLCILWWSWVSCPCRGPRWTWARWDDQGNATPSPEETRKLPLWCQTTSCILLVLPKAQKRYDTVTLILTSFWNAFCVSSSKRISSFMTITSPVSLWVTCYNSYMWVNLELFLEIDPLSDNYNKADMGAPIFTICMLESQKLNVNHKCGQTWPSHMKCFLIWPPPCGWCGYDTLCLLKLMLKYPVSDLDGLPEAAPSQHLSMDEVGRPEDAVCPLGHRAQWFWPTYVLLIGAWRLVNAVAATGGLQAKIPVNREKKKEKHNEHPTMDWVLVH